MSDPAWFATAEITAYQGIVYVQTAGATATPGTADELGYVTSISESHEPDVQEKQYINAPNKGVTLGTYAHKADIEIGYGSGAQTIRQRVISAVTGGTRLKVTIIAGPTATGEKSVYDNAVVTFGRDGDPAGGWTGKISLQSNSWTHTAAS